MIDVRADTRLITCIVPRGKAKGIQRMLVDDYDILDANFHGARGVGRFSPLTARGIGEQQEKDVLEVFVPVDLADEIFERMFFAGEMDRPHGGIIYMTPLTASRTIARETAGTSAPA